MAVPHKITDDMRTPMYTDVTHAQTSIAGGWADVNHTYRGGSEGGVAPQGLNQVHLGGDARWFLFPKQTEIAVNTSLPPGYYWGKGW